jgi:hypothetical protein
MSKNEKLGHGEKATRKFELAIAALLTSSTIERAAEQIGVAPITLRRWMVEPAFKSEYQAARRQVMEQAAAVATLEGVMADQDAPASARVSAARAVLEMGQKAVELGDLDGRVTELEHAAAARDGKQIRAVS